MREQLLQSAQQANVEVLILLIQHEANRKYIQQLYMLLLHILLHFMFDNYGQQPCWVFQVKATEGGNQGFEQKRSVYCVKSFD